MWLWSLKQFWKSWSLCFKSKRPHTHSHKDRDVKTKTTPTNKMCTRCGKESHPRDKCPAKDATCHRCSKKGHYGSQCFSKQLSEITTKNPPDSAFLGTVATDCTPAWFTTVELNGRELSFKLDTGAEVTAISTEAYKRLRKPQLTTPEKILYGPSRQPLKTTGQFSGNFSHKGKATSQRVFVVDGLKTNLLGLPAITALGLAIRTDTVETGSTDFRKRFPSVFQGLGNLGEEFEIHLKPGATPHSLFTPRHVPLPLRPRVKEELDRMEAMGVISKVDQPTPWCAGMVVVPKKEGAIRICADASSYGLGAVLMQQSDSTWKPVAYASRSLTETEKRYAQIEKEALASTWACEKFSTYILGKKFLIETDHKPLVPLLGTKHLDSLPPRVLRFRLRLARFDYSIVHVPGKLLYTADALSRSPSTSVQNDSQLQEEAEEIMEVSVMHLPASTERIDAYRKAQSDDSVCSAVSDYCRKGWPQKNAVPTDLIPYWKVRGNLTVDKKNLLLYGKRIVVPKLLRKETMEKIHTGHQGIQRCRLRANTSVWWPGLSHELDNLVKQCHTCAREFTPRRQPMIPTQLPGYPWQKVGTDLFHFKGANYLLVVDYFSRYPETVKLTNTTSQNIIDALKNIFSRYGIPEIVMSDNGPQYSSQEFADFAKNYDFHHKTSSPHFAQSNGQAERMVQTVKRLLKDSKDPYLSLLTYRSTPFPWCNLSPAELLMGRCLRANIPILKDQLTPKWEFLNEFRSKNQVFKERQRSDYDRHHGVRTLSSIPPNSEVWITTGNQPDTGTVVSSTDTPRSYTVETPTGQVRRNRQHLNIIPGNNESIDQRNYPAR